MSVATIIVNAINAGAWLPRVAEEAAINFLTIIDLLLIAVALQMIALGIYRIFLNTSLPVPAGLAVSSFHQLKGSLVKLVSVVLLLIFLEQAFVLGPGLAIMDFGIGIAVVVAAFAWSMGKTKGQD